jgi:hypothetical protein
MTRIRDRSIEIIGRSLRVSLPRSARGGSN